MGLSKLLHARHETITDREQDSAEKKSAATSSAEEDIFGSNERVVLPHASEALEYERIVPGTGEWIMNFMNARRRRYEEFVARELQSERIAFISRMLYTLSLWLLSILAGWYCLRNGAPMSGVIMFLTGVALLYCLLIFNWDDRADRDPPRFSTW